MDADRSLICTRVSDERKADPLISSRQHHGTDMVTNTGQTQRETRDRHKGERGVLKILPKDMLASRASPPDARPTMTLSNSMQDCRNLRTFNTLAKVGAWKPTNGK